MSEETGRVRFDVIKTVEPAEKWRIETWNESERPKPGQGVDYGNIYGALLHAGHLCSHVSRDREYVLRYHGPVQDSEKDVFNKLVEMHNEIARVRGALRR